MLLALYGVFANVGTFSVLCSIRLTFSIPRPYGSRLSCSPELARGRPKSDLTIPMYVHVGENRHGNLGTYSRDGDGDDPLLFPPTWD